MRLVRIAILGSLLFSGGNSALAAPTEAYFGHRGSTCGVPDTTSTKSLAEPAKVPSPVDPADARLIGKFAAAVKKGQDTARFVDSTQVPSQTLVSCEAALSKLQTAAKCVSTPLYLLGDGEIRQEWLCGGSMNYLLFYTVEKGKLANIWAMDGQMPIVVVPSGSN